MTSYIARHGGRKKKNILHQREVELRGEILRGGSTESMQRRVERLRSAQLAVIKALLDEITTVVEEQEDQIRSRRNKLLRQKAHWENIPEKEIVLLYSGPDNDTPEIEPKKWWDFRRL